MPRYVFKMPDIGEGVVEAEITAWHVAVGDRVSEEDPIADAMTDKATIELTSPVDGVITALGCEEGDMLAVGAMLASFETNGGETPEGQDSEPASAQEPAYAQEREPAAVTPTAPVSGEYIFKMPDIGEGVVEAEITAWHVAVGDRVSEEDPVADAMTDKATIELTAPVDGVISALGCGEGDMLAVGAMLASFKVEGEIGAVPVVSKLAPKPTTPKLANPKPARKHAMSSPPAAAVKVLASPAVRRRAREAGLTLSDATPTGASGQVTHIDLDRLEKALEPLPGETRIKIIGLRRVIAQRMQESKRNIPHFTYVDEIDMTELEALRKRANAKSGEHRPKLTVLPFIIRALALTLREWPQFNARYDDNAGYVSQFSALNLGMATMTDKGLIVPVLKDAGSMSIWDMAAEIARLSAGARNNQLSTDDLTGASTTLTSLGPLGGIVTTPVINRPEVAIFGPNKIRPHLVMEDGDVVQRQVMNFSVSCDHRVIDGYDAAAMVQDLKAYLQDPTFMFLA